MTGNAGWLLPPLASFHVVNFTILGLPIDSYSVGFWMPVGAHSPADGWVLRLSLGS